MGGALPAADIAWSYDAAGNIRRSLAHFWTMNQTGSAQFQGTQDYWYRFDSMNRVVTAKGALQGGAIVGGTSYQYDAAGQRVKATRGEVATAQVENPNYDQQHDPQSPPPPRTITAQYDALVEETYGYDAGGALATVRIEKSGFIDNGNGTASAAALTGTGELKARFWNDLAGRVTRQIDYLFNGDTNGTVAYDRQVAYNAKGQVSGETVSSRRGAETWTSSITNQYGTGTGYALGAVTWTQSVDTRIAGGSYLTETSTTTSNIGWRDGAITTSSSFAKTGQATYSTSYTYGLNGAVESITVGGGTPYTVTFTNDMGGQAVRRDRGAVGTTGPHEVWYRFGGKEMGTTGNNGTLNTSYTASIAQRTQAPGTGPFRGGATAGAMVADFDQSIAAITSYSQGPGSGSGAGSMGGSYEVQSGDTLAGIASQLWGDSALWYRLAEVNGLGAGSALVEGQRLTIPTGVMKNTHNASTFSPYDPSEVLGDLSSASPAAQAAKKNKCGAFGAVLLAVVAVAVSVVTYGALAGPSAGLLTSIGAGIASGAAGSIASQAVGVATGIQDKFDWKGVALAAIGGGIGAGVGNIGGKIGTFLNADALVSNVAKGVFSNVATQGIAVATGLQGKFDWAGVAAAGLGAGATGVAARTMGASGVGAKPGGLSATTSRGAGFYANQAASGLAGAIASGAARSLIEGTSFGDNVLRALPDVIGSTIGNMVADPIAAKIALAKEQAAAKREHETNAASLSSLINLPPTVNLITDELGGVLSLINGLAIVYGQAQPENYDPDDPLADVRDEFSGERVFETVVVGTREAIQDGVTSAFEGGLYLGIEAVKQHPYTTELATAILDRFTSDSPNRTFVFDSRTPYGRAAWDELLTLGPSSFFVSYLDNTLRVLARNSGGQVRDGKWILREGATATQVMASNFLSGTGIAPGAFLDVGNLFYDGAQLGDVVGTISSGMNARVHNGRVIFEAENRTTLTSAAYGNVTGDAASRVMNMPETGPYSPVRQIFRLEVPINDLQRAVYDPRPLPRSRR